jgi:transposase
MLIPDNLKVHLYCGITDMRKSINTLGVLVNETFGMEVSDGHLFLFRSRCGSKLKALYYEENSFILWYKRLHKGKFIFPRNIEGNVELTKEHLAWLMVSNKYTYHQGEIPSVYKDFY